VPDLKLVDDAQPRSGSKVFVIVRDPEHYLLGV
jgi:hypothetical protein